MLLCKFTLQQMRELRDKWHTVCYGCGSWQWGETCAECCCPTSVLSSTTALLLCYLHGLLSRAGTGISNHMPDAVGFWLVGSNKINGSFMVLHVSLCSCFQEASGIALCRPVSGLTLMNCDSAHLWTPQPVLPHDCQTSRDKWLKKAVVFPTWILTFLLSPNKTTQ